MTFNLNLEFFKHFYPKTFATLDSNILKYPTSASRLFYISSMLSKSDGKLFQGLHFVKLFFSICAKKSFSLVRCLNILTAVSCPVFFLFFFHQFFFLLNFAFQIPSFLTVT